VDIEIVVGRRRRRQDDVVRGHLLVHVMIVVHCKAKLLQIVLALAATSSFTGLLNGGQQQGDEHRDNCDDHQQFDQGERFLSG